MFALPHKTNNTGFPKSTFSQPFKEKCTHEVVRIGISMIIFHLSKAWKAEFSILWCNISGEAAGEISN